MGILIFPYIFIHQHLWWNYSFKIVSNSFHTVKCGKFWSISILWILFNSRKWNYGRKLYSQNKWILFLRNCNYPWFLIYSYLPQDDKFDKSPLNGFCAWRTSYHSINEVPSHPLFSCLVVWGIASTKTSVSSENQCLKKSIAYFMPALLHFQLLTNKQ